MSNRIRFLLGDELREVDVADPTETVLQYLRSDPARRGIKEGCAEGDCGACTVALGELGPDGAVHYRAVNACIQFLPTLDGKQLLTVEDIADPKGGALHPVQQAMVDSHGSQCGFCTPGFVMSMFVGYLHDREAGRKPSRAEIDDRLAGNLCRCTGYRPIIDATAKAAMVPETRARAAPKLAEIAPKRALVIDTGARAFYAPRKIADLAALLKRHPDATILAGGTDVGLWVTKQHRDLATVISIGEIAELKTVEERNLDWWIGAGAAYARAMPTFAAIHKDLAELVRRIGSTQIRNAGTVGGNIANGSPIGDTLPALIALGAMLHLRRGALKRSIPIEKFFVGYRRTALAKGEFVEGVSIPKLDPTARFAAYKVSKRFDQDISAVCAAIRLSLAKGKVKDARIAYGGMAETPKRARKAEKALIGKSWSEDAVRSAMAALDADFAPIGDMRASARYRRTVAGNLLLRFLHETNGADHRTRVLEPRTAS